MLRHGLDDQSQRETTEIETDSGSGKRKLFFKGLLYIDVEAVRDYDSQARARRQSEVHDAEHSSCIETNRRQ